MGEIKQQPKILLRGDTKEMFEIENTVLNKRELIIVLPNGLDTDLSKKFARIKLGDGKSKYKNLHYIDGMLPRDKILLYGLLIVELVHIAIELISYF